MELQEIIDTLRAWPPFLVYLLLFASALLEYVFPPVPGDTFVVAGAVLVSAFGWSPIPVVLIITLGGILGSWFDFRLGLWLIKTNKLDRFGASGRASIDKLVAQMQKRGPVYLVLNRFLPGVRAFFFIAAGIAGLKTSSVLFWSAISALLWNIGLVALGYAVGSNLDELSSFLATYSTIAWVVIGAVAAFFIGRAIYRKGRAPKASAKDAQP